jgi:Mrp family chromosome partitioning ATPase
MRAVNEDDKRLLTPPSGAPIHVRPVTEGVMTQSILPDRDQRNGHDDHDMSSRVPADRPSDSIARPIEFDAASLVDALPRPLAESLHYLVARLQFGDDALLPSPIGVVSALHQEGVTTISQALAAVLAHDLDVSVCWVGLTGSSAPRKRKATPTVPPGVFEVLTQQISLSEALEPTADARLKLLHPGRMPQETWPAVARSHQLGQLLLDLKSSFDIVIVDVPPVLAGSEALSILRHTAAQLMVVRYGVTTAQQVRQAADEIHNIPSLGVVMNQFHSNVPRRLSRLFSS